jgi:ubiquinone biosynthesis protein COQ4
MSPSSSPRIRPLDALRALSALVRDPEDTSQVFAIIEALSGANHQHIARRLARSSEGARLLREQRSLAQVLADRARLEAMPQESLGRAYLALCDRVGISPDGLVAASESGEPHPFSQESGFVYHMLRDSHDLWHVVTGYQTDTVGEAALLAFSFAQTRNPGVALIALLAFAASGRQHPWVRPLLIEAFRRGLASAWFPAVDWEAQLARPLEQVRRELNVGTLPSYRPIWSDEFKRNRELRENDRSPVARALGALASLTAQAPA